MRKILLAVLLASALAGCAATGFGDNPSDTAPSSVQSKFGNGGVGNG